MSLLGDIGHAANDALGAPQKLVFGGKKPSQVLHGHGLLGALEDAVLDPVNVIPLGAGLKAIKGAELAAKLVNKADDVNPFVQAVRKESKFKLPTDVNLYGIPLKNPMNFMSKGLKKAEESAPVANVPKDMRMKIYQDFSNGKFKKGADEVTASLPDNTELLNYVETPASKAALERAYARKMSRMKREYQPRKTPEIYENFRSGKYSPNGEAAMTTDFAPSAYASQGMESVMHPDIIDALVRKERGMKLAANMRSIVPPPPRGELGF